MKAAWIIEWCASRTDSPITRLRPHILPRRWQAARVLDYMRCLYWNSDLWIPGETMRHVNARVPQGIFVKNEGPRLFYGNENHLLASFVHDLVIECTHGGIHRMTWTSPAGVGFDGSPPHKVLVGTPTKRSFECRL